MLESNSNSPTAIDDLSDSFTEKSFLLEKSIPTPFDISSLLKSFTPSTNSEAENSLQDLSNFDLATTINNFDGFDLESDHTEVVDELPVSENLLTQTLFTDNLDVGLDSQDTFSATDSSGISNDFYGLNTVQANSLIYSGHVQGSLKADRFNYTPGAGNQLTVVSGNGNLNYGRGYYDSLNLSSVSVNQVVDYSFADINGGGETFNLGNGDRVFDYITLDNGDKFLFEGIDKVSFAEGEIDLTVNPNDTEYLDQWNLHMMGVQNAWRFTTGSDDVLVGVQDTGLGVVNGSIHHDLRTTWFYNDGNGLSGNLSDDFYSAGRQRSETSSHGTAVQGIIAADTNNGIGIAGINWNSDVYNIDVLGGNRGDLSLVEATQRMINHANSRGQNLIVNMSLGTSSFGVNYHSDFEQLVANNQGNALFVIAAGNSGNLGRAGLASPAVLAKKYDNVIAVGASWGNYDYYGNQTEPGQRIDYDNWWGSQYGSGLTLMGPSEVPTTEAYRYSSFFSGFSYEDDFNGTSAATPNVAGVASLVWSANSDLAATDIKDILSDTAYDLGREGYDWEYGHGFVNADAAVRRAMAMSATNSFTGVLNSTDFATANLSANAFDTSAIEPLTGNTDDNEFTLEEDSLLLADPVSDHSFFDSLEDSTISFGAASSNELPVSDYLADSLNSPLALSNGLGEEAIFYNEIDV